MKKAITGAFLLLAMAGTIAWAQHRDPLTDAETDQLRETAQDPPKRLSLMVKFARARMEAVEQLRADPKAGPDRGAKVRDLLEDLESIFDELDDNIDDYASRKADLRKPLKEIIEADTELQNKLQAIQNAVATEGHSAAEVKEYRFVLENTMDAVNSNLDNAKKLLEEQVASKGELKKK
jgi:chromosome segregation ATPase